MSIKIIGDSHCIAFEGIIDVKWFGLNHKTTMYQFTQDPVYNLSSGIETVFFSYGEIDCRYSILRQIFENNKKGDEVIEELINNYVDKVVEYRDKYYISVGIYNIPPTSKHNTCDIYGTAIERKIITVSMNNKLEERCKQMRVPFLKTYDVLVDEEGFLRSDIADNDGNGVHVAKDHQILLVKPLMELMQLKP